MPRELTPEDVQSFRDRLCDAFAARFAQSGYSSVTLRALAEDIGCSPMTPYRYFKDKDEIFAAARAAGFRRLCERLQSAATDTDDPVQKARKTFRTYLEFARNEPDTYRLMYTNLQPTPTPFPELEDAIARSRQIITQMAAAVPQVRDSGVNPSAVAHAFWAALHGVISIQLNNAFGDETDFEEVVAFLTTVLIEGGRVFFKLDQPT